MTILHAAPVGAKRTAGRLFPAFWKLRRPTDPKRTRPSLATKTARLREIEPEIRAAIAASPEETGTVSTEDAEARERRELRGRVLIGNHVLAAMESRSLDGAEAGIQPGAGVEGNGSFPAGAAGGGSGAPGSDGGR